jgi:sarcosine oxidase, subunit alpha
MSGTRLQTGGQIDRRKTVTFRFDGRQIEGFAGDTIASALMAAGVRIVGRSFRLHRPRGIFACGLEEPNALVHVKVGNYQEPNVRATLFPIRPELEVFSQNCWPNLHWDCAAFFDWLPKIWSAGFYHKTFMWPRWHTYEPIIRAVAGIGRVRAPGATTGTSTQRDLEADVLVCGGGAAGLTAARAAAEAGARVAVVDSGPAVEGVAAGTGGLNLELFSNTHAVGVFGEKVIIAIQHLGWSPEGPRRCLLRIRAKAMVVATGAIEQPMVFENNDRPGVMLAGAVTEYLHRYAVTPGRRAVLVTNNDGAYSNLDRWRDAGISIVGIVDTRTEPGQTAEIVARACHAQLIRAPGGLVVSGRSGVTGVTVRDAVGTDFRIACDLVAMSGGYIPNVHLYSQAHGALFYRPELHGYAPVPTDAGVYAAGLAAGNPDFDYNLTHASAVGTAAARFANGDRVDTVDSGNADPSRHRAMSSIGPTRIAGRTHRQWIDFQHDVTVADADSAIEQGYTHVEHFKRYTTTGMAVDQGKTSVRNALDHLARKTDQMLSDLRPPTYRPPFVPLPVALAAGPNVGSWYRPERRLPAHAEHLSLGAHFDDVGGWRRPLYYGSAHIPGQGVEAEIRAVRSGAGLFEARRSGSSK